MSAFPRLPGGSAPIADAARLGTVLGIWAHPDDEAFLSAGLMAAARDTGHRVVCVTATLGERGTGDPAGWPPGRLAAVRKHELRASLAALDVTEHHLLGLADGALAALGEERVRQWWSTETFVAAGAARARAAQWGTWRVAA